MKSDLKFLGFVLRKDGKFFSQSRSGVSKEYDSRWKELLARLLIRDESPKEMTTFEEIRKAVLEMDTTKSSLHSWFRKKVRPNNSLAGLIESKYRDIILSRL